MHTDNTPTVATTDTVEVFHSTPTDASTPKEVPYVLDIDPHAGDPASTLPSTNVVPESGTQDEVRVQLKELAKHFSCVSTKQTEDGVELYLFTQTRVAHPTFVESIRQKLADKEDVGKNYILTGATIEEILENLAANGL